ncbi:MAG: lipoyl(octanoyl) transferase LipB [Candidatus Bipolaricaulia bacterium]
MWLLDLGRQEYRAVWELQRELLRRRAGEELPDLLILVEHPHTITYGRSLRQASDPVPFRDTVPVYEVDRGGQATYHGPGQLVGYPIIKLEGERRDLHRYLRDLEALLIGGLSDFGIQADRRTGYTGVWVPPLPEWRKIASIGVGVRQWVTYHGFALNVTTDLNYFRLIEPCGLDARLITSIAQLVGEVGMDTVKDRVTVWFASVFRTQLISVEVADVAGDLVKP